MSAHLSEKLSKTTVIGQQGFFSSFCILASLASTGDVGDRGMTIGLQDFDMFFSTSTVHDDFHGCLERIAEAKDLQS